MDASINQRRATSGNERNDLLTQRCTHLRAERCRLGIRPEGTLSSEERGETFGGEKRVGSAFSSAQRQRPNHFALHSLSFEFKCVTLTTETFTNDCRCKETEIEIWKCVREGRERPGRARIDIDIHFASVNRSATFRSVKIF